MSGRGMVPEVLRREPQFRLLFSGQLLSVLGDRMMLVALPFAVLESGGGAGAVGLVVAAQLAPFVIFSLLGGAISDRSERRKVLIRSDLGRFAVQATGGVLLLSGDATPALLAVLVVIYGSADAFFQPAFTGLLPQTLSDPIQLQPANALRGLSFSVAAVVGPALAGVFVAAIGAGAAFLFDAGTFAVSVLFLLRLRPARARTPDGRPAPILASVREGWREVVSRPWLRSGLAAMCAYHGLVLPAVFVLGPIFVSQRLGGPGAWAAVVVSFGLGSIAGDLLLLRFRPSHALRMSAVGLVVASTQAAVYGADVGLAVTCLLQFIAAMGVVAFFTLWEVSLQEHIPAEMLSRVSSWDYLAGSALMPVGTALAGPLAVVFGIRATLLVMSVLGVAAALGYLALPSVRSLPRGTEEWAIAATKAQV
jgi:MFS family permease